MVQGQVEAIKEQHELERFQAFPSDVAVKDHMDFMSRCWFSMTAGRTDPIEHSYTDARSKRIETIRITGSPEYGIATIHDQDLLIFVISQWLEAKRLGLEMSRRVCFTPYQFFAWINREPTGSAYQRLRDALQRLQTTNIETTLTYKESRKRERKERFYWISEVAVTEEENRIRGIEVVLGEWLFESVQNLHVLTLDKRYFDILGPVERWIYLYARKATGGPNGVWRESFKKLYEKSASQQAYKHYASTLRKLVKKNDLPGLRLEQCASVTGQDMLRMERVEKRPPGAIKGSEPALQLPLIEQSPLEEAWENVLEILRSQLTAPTVGAWFEKLRLIELSDGVLLYRAPTKFIADTVESKFRSRLLAAWQCVNPEVMKVEITAGKSAKLAA